MTPSEKWACLLFDVCPIMQAAPPRPVPDAVAIAYQTGRLDFLTATLAVLAILLTLLSVLGARWLIMTVKRQAREQAEKSVEAWLSDHAPGLAGTMFDGSMKMGIWTRRLWLRNGINS